MLFAWISTLDSVFPVVGLLGYPLAPPVSSTPKFVRPVIVLPNIERLAMVLLAFPQQAACAEIPNPKGPAKVFERMLRFRRMLFSEYWIGSRDGYWKSLAPSP